MSRISFSMIMLLMVMLLAAGACASKDATSQETMAPAAPATTHAAGEAMGQPNVRPDPLPEWWFPNEVDADYVASHIVVPRNTDKVVLIDARPYMAKYAVGYIPTAINIPPTKLAEMGSMLPADKSVPLIFYCEGFACKLSHKAAFEAQKLGYQTVVVYAAGFPEWKAQGRDVAVESEYVKDMIAAGGPYLIVDSRPHNKYLEGQIPGAVSVPDSKFAEMQGMLPADKATPLVFYCGGFACPLSHKSATKAKELGYANVVINESGYPGWSEKFGASQVAIQAGDQEGSMDVAQFEKLLQENPDSIVLIDVRDPEEYAAGHFPTAKNMPVDQVEKNIDQFGPEKPVVFVCSTGARSGECYYMFLDKRPDMKDVYYIDATIEYKDGGYTITPAKK